MGVAIVGVLALVRFADDGTSLDPVRVTEPAAVFRDDVAVRKLAATVEREEAKYASIDLDFERIRIFKPLPNGQARTNIASMARVRYSSDGNRKRVDWDESRDDRDRPNDPYLEEGVAIYDGTHTYVRVTKGVERFTKEKGDWTGEYGLPPHRVFSYGDAKNVRLSDVIEGSGPDKSSTRKTPRDWDYSGVEGLTQLSNRPCVKIWTGRLEEDDSITHSTVQWLDVDRNHLPAKIYFFRLINRPEVTSECEVTSWREIKPGLWFPMSTHGHQYDVHAIWGDEEWRLLSETMLDVTRITATPDFKDDYFDTPIDANEAVDLDNLRR